MRRLGGIIVALVACFTLTPALASAHPKGVNLEDNYTGLPDAGFYRDLPWLQQAHVDVVRIYVTPREEQTDAAAFTAYFRALQHRHIRVLLDVWQLNTRWMEGHPRRFAALCADAARRWHQFLVGIEVGNEPNDTMAHTTGYVPVIQAAYPAIKRIAPRLPVIAGVLAYTSGQDLEAMYRAGLHGYFDAISAHPYTDNTPPEQGDTGGCAYSFACGVPWLHQVMAEHGDGNRKLWLTELGWSTKRYPSAPVSERDRAEYMRQVGAMTSAWSWIGGVMFFQLRYGHPRYEPNATERDLELGLALVSERWRPSPGFWALARTGF